MRDTETEQRIKTDTARKKQGIRGKKSTRLLIGGLILVLLSSCGKRFDEEERLSGDERNRDFYEQWLNGEELLRSEEESFDSPQAELDTVDGAGDGIDPRVKEDTPEITEQEEQIDPKQGRTFSAEDFVETPENTESVPKLRKGEFSTWYGSSTWQRKANINRAAELLNNTVILPGETFSCSKTISPITEENGYFPAGTYVAGKVQDGIGGGVCQISTTLYNAALYAGVTVVERAPHSMAVKYVDPARDAAIAGDYKDLKLRNDFDTPITIYASTEDGTLSIQIQTGEADDRKSEISLESVVLETIEPGEPVVTVDETMPKNYLEVTQSAHTGYVAELYRIVKRNGEVISREKVNTSYYSATPQYVTVGGK